MKKYLNNAKEELSKSDFIVLGVILILYTILSFINLGSTTNPQTFKSVKLDDEIIIELEKTSELTGMDVYEGVTVGIYKVFISEDNNNYEYVGEAGGQNVFFWNKNPFVGKGKYLKLVAESNAKLGEIGIYNDKNKILKIKRVTLNNKEIKQISDEQETIPKQISFMNSTYFDEIYFARSAYEYVKGEPIYEWTHPPLGKLIQAIPIKITGIMAPFYYRLMGNIAGILMIAIMYFFGKAMFKKRKYALLSALLMTFDCFHFAHTRMGTIDSFLVLFIMLSYYYMYKYITTNKENKNLFLSGLFFGCASTTKWTGLYAGLGLAIIFFIHVFKNKKMTVKLFSKCTLFYVIIPLTIYISSYLLFPNLALTYTDSIKDIITQNKQMFIYHSTLTATHFFSSKFYTWPFTYKPVWYYSQDKLPNLHGGITGVGNVAIWWFGVIAFIYLVYHLPKLKDRQNSLFLIIAILSMYIPYAFIGRVMFLYHYFPVLPFIMFAITNLFRDLTEKFKTDVPIIMYLIVVIAVFVVYYPAISGTFMPVEYFDAIKIFDTWYF